MKALNPTVLQVIVGRRTKRITLERAIASKVAFFPKLISRDDLLVLYDNLLWLQQKSYSDPDFSKKFGLYLKVLAYILKNHRGKDALTAKSIQELSDSFLRNLSGFLLSKRHTLSTLKRIMQKVEVRHPKQPGVLKSSLSPAAYIGVGYRDKGTAKKPWIDGSPSWQEIAMQPIKEFINEK